jgi:cardiolipin synthase (CMP-forming)
MRQLTSRFDGGSRPAAPAYGGIPARAMPLRGRTLGNVAPSVYCHDRIPGAPLSLPNLITLARILSVPIMVWSIMNGWMLAAFLLFLAAGVSDAIDGYLAKRFAMTSELGAYLDPLADKALIVSIYVTLGVSGEIPRWLVILVVSRDIMIVGAVLLAWLVGKPLPMKPLLVSKFNTAAQLLFAGVVLATLGLRFHADWLVATAMAAVTLLTLISVAAYVREWMRHMGSDEAIG